MYRKTLFSLVAALFVITLIAPQPKALAGGSDYRVRARLSGDTPMSGQAKYRERLKNGILEQRFSVEVEDGTAGASVDITLNGLMIGTIVLDGAGFGELQFRTETFIDDPGDGSPIPTDFPQVQPGDVINVGPIVGMFS